MPPKPTVYIESTIPSYLTTRPSRDLIVAAHQQPTSDWWSNATEKYSLYISATVLDEITVGDTEMADRRIAILRGVQMLPADPAIAGLADEYTNCLGCPLKPIMMACIWHMELCLAWTM